MAQGNVIFEESFKNDLGQFKVEGTVGDKADIWNFGVECAKADAYSKMNDKSSYTSYLVSPEFEVKMGSYAIFDYKTDYVSDPKSEIGFCIRTNGGEWEELVMPEWSASSSYVSSGKILIPEAYAGKMVQVAFKYFFRNCTDSGVWEVKNFVVQEKAEPAISFSEIEVEAILGEAFEAPALSNPNEVQVSYASDNAEVATVDSETGVVTLVGEGTATITATSVETEDFKSVSVSYILTVKPGVVYTVIFEESFSKDLGEFKAEGAVGDKADIWNYGVGCAKADAYSKMEEAFKGYTSYLVSPEFKAMPNSIASFEYKTDYFNNVQDEIGFCIREVGGEWEELDMLKVDSESFTTSGDIVIPNSYAGKNVQVAFKYSFANHASAGIWQIKNFVVKYAEPTYSVVFEESFSKSLGEFATEGNNGDKAPIWSFGTGTARADGYSKMDDSSVSNTVYLVSPEFKAASNGIATFDYTTDYFGNVKEEIGFCIREVGGEWEELEMPVKVCSSNFVSSGDIIIPDSYAGKNVQVGFKYYFVSSSSSGVWEIKNLVVKGIESAPVEKADPEISFEVTEVVYVIGSGDFNIPVLNNPHNVEIVYSSSDTNMADVDQTGFVTMYDLGTFTITATSVENEQYKSATASYTVTVTDEHTDIEGVETGELMDGKIYDLQGRRVNKLSKGVYVVNGKKIIVK